MGGSDANTWLDLGLSMGGLWMSLVARLALTGVHVGNGAVDVVLAQPCGLVLVNYGSEETLVARRRGRGRPETTARARRSWGAAGRAGRWQPRCCRVPRGPAVI